MSGCLLVYLTAFFTFSVFGTARSIQIPIMPLCFFYNETAGCADFIFRTRGGRHRRIMSKRLLSGFTASFTLLIFRTGCGTPVVSGCLLVYLTAFFTFSVFGTARSIQIPIMPLCFFYNETAGCADFIFRTRGGRHRRIMSKRLLSGFTASFTLLIFRTGSGTPIVSGCLSIELAASCTLPVFGTGRSIQIPVMPLCFFYDSSAG